jgi:hypothetical protein
MSEAEHDRRERSTNHVKVFFRLERDEDGYPPADVESLWAIERALGYEIDNVPFFVKGIGLGDVVRADERDGALWFHSLLTESGHGTIRVIMLAKDLERRAALKGELRECGCAIEQSHLESLFAVDIAPGSNIQSALTLLRARSDEEVIEYEEGCKTW